MCRAAVWQSITTCSSCAAWHITLPSTLEGFFGTLKSDFFHGTDWRGVTFAEFRERLGAYIEWYRGGKPKKALGWRTLREHRAALGYAA